MIDPQKLNAESIMPPYPWLAENDLDISNTKKKIEVMQQMGVPYPDGFAEQAVADLQAQAKKIGEGPRAGGIEANDNKEIIALIAYLQRLGTDVYSD
jgi:cytochrome c oxidase cbb3-type subunit I/II